MPGLALACLVLSRDHNPAVVPMLQATVYEDRTAAR